VDDFNISIPIVENLYLDFGLMPEAPTTLILPIKENDHIILYDLNNQYDIFIQLKININI